jgi:2,5-dihydroxypyridine 5,6-dioxygenase
MTMIERYGIPSTKIIEVMRSWTFPFRNVQSGDRLVVFTDDGMDPMVWQSAMAAAYERGAEPMLCLYPRRAYHCGDPPEAAISAARGADVVVALTTTALNSGTPGLRQIRAEGGGSGNTPIWLMEEMTVEILAEGGGRANEAQVKEICELHQRIGAIYDESKSIHVTSASGTDLTADISNPPYSSAERWAAVPFSRNPRTGRLGGGTWPFGEVHVEPVPGTANGTVVWDTTAHYPPGRWKEPVALTIKDGQVVAVDGGHEAEQVRWYLETYGDENSWKVGGEIAIGTNRLCPPNTYIMRSEKKRYGAMHFGIGHGADRGQINSVLRLEGIVDRVTIEVDDKTQISKDGKILV